MVNEYKILTLKKKSCFVDVEVKTFFDSRDSSNDFHDMLIYMSNLIYKVSKNFSTHSFDHAINIKLYVRKMNFFQFFFKMRPAESPEYSIV